MHRISYYVILALSALGSARGALRSRASAEVRCQRLWTPFENYNPAAPQAIVGCALLTISNTKTTPLLISRLTLQWQPKQLDKKLEHVALIPVLYRPGKNHPTRPDSYSHLSHGDWSEKQQQITFNFAEKPYKIMGNEQAMLVVQLPMLQLRKLHEGAFVYTDQCSLTLAPLPRSRHKTQEELCD